MKSGIQKENTKHRYPRGFTLIELLIAITIIAILAGLLLTGVQSARSAVRKAEVAQEIRNLETALTQFHAEFGMYPPSQITLYGTLAGWNNDIRSKSIIQKLWPEFDFTQPLPGGANSIKLNGAQCLVFFLGGVFDSGALNSDGVERGFIGFSKNPRNPFAAAGSNRIGPYHEFVSNRIRPNSPVIPPIGATYIDTFPGQESPLWYISSYDGRGYQAIPEDSLNPDHNPPGGPDRRGELPAGMKDCYRQGFSLTQATAKDYEDEDVESWTVLTSQQLPQAWGMKNYQLISPGPDMVYGLGGYYSEGMKQPNGISAANWSKFLLDRKFHPEKKPNGYEGGDEDNITSFSSNMR